MYLNHGAEQCNSVHECYAIDHLRNIDGFKAMSDAGRRRIMGGEMALWEVPTSELQVLSFYKNTVTAKQDTFGAQFDCMFTSNVIIMHISGHLVAACRRHS